MKRWGNAGRGLAGLLAALALLPGNAPAQPAETLQEQLRQQEEIYRSRGEKTPEGYVINRSLLAYTFTLPDQFGRSLALLGPKDRWLDIGAGQGQAVLDYYAERYDSMNPEGRERRGTKARSIAMSIEDRRTPLWDKTAATLEPGKIRYLYGKRLREYSAEELGQFQLITDVIGGFSYAQDLSLYMEKVLAVLETNGNFYAVLQDVHSDEGSNKPHYAGAPYLTEIVDPAGGKVKICAWLRSIACVRASCELKTDWRPNIEVYRVQKICDKTAVPQLTPVHYQAGTPPERRYQLQGTQPIPPAQRADPTNGSIAGPR